jgi:hypothetical protein
LRDPYADVNSITAGTNTTYVYVDQLDAPAAAADDNGIKMILINRTFLEKIKDEVLRTAIERGLRVHEGLEIVYGEIPKRNKACEAKHNLNQTFYHTLLNIIGDVYIEAHGESSFPAFSKYLSLVLSHLKALSVQGVELKTDQESSIEEWIDEILEKKGIKVNPALIKTVNALFEAVRFGEVAAELLDKNVQEDLEYIVIRIFAARRGENVDGVIQASDEIYHYLHKKYNIPPELHIMAEWRSVSSLCADDEKNQQRKTSGLPILRWKNRDQVEHAIQAAMKETAHKLEELRREGSAGGLLGGPDHAKLTPPTLKDAEFYLSTIRKHVETIRRLQALFKRLAGKRGFASAREGELNLKPSVLQQAYVDSFKPGEDERDYYLVMRHIIPDIDLVIAQDCSGSTSGGAPLFSETAICILESAKRVGKIRTAAVSFGDGIRILKDFNEPVEVGRFYPQSGGGTPMGEALQQTLQFTWRRSSNIRKVLVLATDGYPDSWEKVVDPLTELKRLHVVPIALCVDTEPNDDYRRHFDQVYQVAGAEGLTEAFVRTFIENALLAR